MPNYDWEYMRLSKLLTLTITRESIEYVLKEALKNGFSLNYIKEGCPPLINIAVRDCLPITPELGTEIIRNMLNHGADVNNITTANDQNTLICLCRFAACEASLDLFQEVVDRTDDINYRAEMRYFISDFESRTIPKESAFLALINRYFYPKYSMKIKEERENLLQRMTVLLNAGVDPKDLDEKTWDEHISKIHRLRNKEKEKQCIKELKDFVTDYMEYKQQTEAINNSCAFDYEL